MNAMDPQALFAAAEAAFARGDLAGAVAGLNQALAITPGDARLHFALAHVLKHVPENLPAWHAARRHLRLGLILDPSITAGYLDMAVLGHLTAALAEPRILALLDRAGAMNPADPALWLRQAQIKNDYGRFGPALADARRAAALAPADGTMIHALAEAAAIVDGAASALPWFYRATRLAPDIPKYRMARGMARLAAGEWRGGWLDYEARRDMPEMGLAPVDRMLPETLAGKTVAVHFEQGFGDVIQCLRFLPELVRRGAQVQLALQPALRGLVEGMPGVTLVELGRETADLVLPIMSLPALLDVRPDGAPYLAAPARQQARWAAALAELSGLKVGVCWSGNPRVEAPAHIRLVDRRRSVPLAEFGPVVAGVAGASFVSLQHGYRPGEEPGAYGIRDASAYIRDFTDLAGMIANLDLVITVDTAVAHLAGAMGARVWMLNRFDSCWRWTRGARDTHWYRSMTILSQRRPMDWSAPLAELAAGLRALVEDRAAAGQPAAIAARNTSP